jgi:PBP1b-binding outer membrane lipoprotein LpoB
MKSTVVVKAKKKVELIIGILFLIFFLGGCVVPSERGGNTRKCREAEAAVKKAQKQYDDANQNLANASKDPNASNNISTAMKTLEEAEEIAFKMCSPSPTR